MQIDTGVLFPLISVLLAIAGFLGGKLSNAKSDGKADGELITDIKYIKRTQEELREDVRQYGMNYTEVREELARLKGRLEKLEKIVELYHKGVDG